MNNYKKLKTAILTKSILVNADYLPANSKIFTIMFYNRDLAETTIRAVIGENVCIIDPLVEHRNDILKAIESCIWIDVFLKSIENNIYTLDMQRSYFKKRNRNRKIYYAAKELSSQEVKDMRYEHLKQVSITFIYEKNTTPSALPIAKIQFTDVNTKEIYSDLLTLYEVNLNKITDEANVNEDLLILKAFLSITCHEELCEFVNRFDTVFSKQLVTEYINAVTDDALLLKVEGSEKFMFKLTAERLYEERIEGREEGLEIAHIETAREMFADGFDIEKIAKYIKMPVDWIESRLMQV